MKGPGGDGGGVAVSRACSKACPWMLHPEDKLLKRIILIEGYICFTAIHEFNFISFLF